MDNTQTPRLLSGADAAADLAGVSQLVSSEGARAHADFLDFGGHEKPANLIRTLVSERDALAGRVAELEAERAELRGAIDDAAYQYSQYIVEDTAHCALTEYMLSAFDATLSTTPESKP